MNISFYIPSGWFIYHSIEYLYTDSVTILNQDIFIKYIKASYKTLSNI